MADGQTDSYLTFLRPNIKIFDLSVNYGHKKFITLAQGDQIVTFVNKVDCFIIENTFINYPQGV